jgi:hypothetical protein
MTGCTLLGSCPKTLYVPGVGRIKSMSKKDLREQIADNADLILTGNILAIDPSSTSLGWGVAKQGAYVDGGVKRYRGDVNIRLYKIHNDVCSLIEDNFIDMLLIERLRPVNNRLNKSGGAYTPVELLWSAGAVLGASPLPFIEVSPASWKIAAKDHGLEKSDINDAHAMLLRVIGFANGEYT